MKSACLIALACLLSACASAPRSDANAGATGTQALEPATGPAAPVVNSGDATPAIGSGIEPSDPALGLMPGFIDRRQPSR